MAKATGADDRLLLYRARRLRCPVVCHPAGRYRGFLWLGLAAYLLAVAAQVPFIAQTFYTGPLVRSLGGVDISWIVGGVAGAVLYLLALRLTRPAGPQRRTHARRR